VRGVPAAVSTLALASICRKVTAVLAGLFNVTIKAMPLFCCHFLSPSRPASPSACTDGSAKPVDQQSQGFGPSVDLILRQIRLAFMAPKILTGFNRFKFFICEQNQFALPR
jgi:hypothetical protein